MITKNTTLAELLDCAKNTVNEVASGEKFIVRDLFRGFEWNRIPVGNRTKLGSMFYAYAQGNGSLTLEPQGKTPQNQQIYLKK